MFIMTLNIKLFGSYFMTGIFQTLEQLGLTSKQSRVLYTDRTRDVENLQVW